MKKILATVVACSVLGAWAQEKDPTIKGIEEYRAMLEDGNPAELFEVKGEELWKKKARPEKCLAGTMRLG